MASDRLMSSMAWALLAICVALALMMAQVPPSTVGAQTAVPDVNTQVKTSQISKSSEFTVT